MCRWVAVLISHKPKSIYFQLKSFNFFLPAEGKHGRPPSILLQLATDASLQSANPNCTWWAMLIALVLPDLATAVRGNFSHGPFTGTCQTDTLPHTHMLTISRTEGGWGHRGTGLLWWPQISCCNCISIPAPIILQACIVQWGDFVYFGVKII